MMGPKPLKLCYIESALYVAVLELSREDVPAVKALSKLAPVSGILTMPRDKHVRSACAEAQSLGSLSVVGGKGAQDAYCPEDSAASAWLSSGSSE
jgi:hypothetical protein